MNKKFVENIKERLLERKAKIETELKRIADKNPDDVSEEDYVTKFPHFGDEIEDNAEEVSVYEENMAIEQNLEKNLRDINSTLKRIDEGTYGICKYCGEPIDPRRLEARPVAGTCMPCKSKILKQ